MQDNSVLFPYFDAAYTALVGKPASNFVFEHGKTPLASFSAVTLTCLTYFLLIFGTQHLLKDKKPFKCNRLFQIHNASVCLASTVLFALTVEQLLPLMRHQGMHFTMCSPNAYTQKLELLYYLNYLMKYWELADTVFMVLKKKPLKFLHYYHHSSTLVLCFTQLLGKTVLSWLPITLNLGIHILMYYYFLLASVGGRPWWKRYLTGLQISQFIVDLVIIYSLIWSYFADKHWPYLPNVGTCSGETAPVLFGTFVLTSYLFMFINFYKETYRRIVPATNKIH